MSQGLDNLIKVSAKLFIKKGYYNTSMSDIGKSAKLNKGSIYHYINSKEELVNVVVENLSSQFYDAVFSCAYDTNLTEKKRLGHMLKQIEDYFLDAKGCLMWQLATELRYDNPRLTNPISKFFDLWVEAFSHLLAKQYTKKKAFDLAVDSIIQIEGAVTWLRIRNDHLPLKRVLSKINLMLE